MKVSKHIFDQIAVDINYIIDNSKSVKSDMERAINGWMKMYEMNRHDVQRIATYHAINIHRYNEQFLLNADSFVN